MARLFDDGSSEYLGLDSAPVTSAPFTMACWCYTDDVTANQVLMWIGDKDSASHMWYVRIYGGHPSDVIECRAQAGGAAAAAVTSSGVSVTTWHHAVYVEAASNSRTVYLDGGNSGSDATSRSPAGADRVTIGVAGDSSKDFYMSGRIAEAAIWSVALTATEAAILAEGYSPLFVRPQSLVAYWPLIRDTDDDVVGGYNLTAYNTPTIAVHPPVLYPAPVLVTKAVSAVVRVPRHPAVVYQVPAIY